MLVGLFGFSKPSVARHGHQQALLIALRYGLGNERGKHHLVAHQRRDREIVGTKMGGGGAFGDFIGEIAKKILHPKAQKGQVGDQRNVFAKGNPFAFLIMPRLVAT